MISEAWQQRFGGIVRLYGAAAGARLRAARVAVIGVGGVGSWTAEALARSGVGNITLIDRDDVCITNTNRQTPALEGTVGRPKALVLAERLRSINPEINAVPLMEFFTEATADRLLEGAFDVVVDAVDRMSIKALIIAKALSRGCAVITAGAAGGKRDGTQVRLDDLARAGSDELLRQVRKRLRRVHGFAKGEGVTFGVRAVFSPEAPVFPRRDGTCGPAPETQAEQGLRLDCADGYGASTFVTGAFGFAAAGEVVRLLAAGLSRAGSDPPASAAGGGENP